MIRTHFYSIKSKNENAGVVKLQEFKHKPISLQRKQPNTKDLLFKISKEK